MSDIGFFHRIKRFSNKVRVLGIRDAFKSIPTLFTLIPKNKHPFPLSFSDRNLILAQSKKSISAFVQANKPKKPKNYVPHNLFAFFPRTFEFEDRTMNYEYFPAVKKSKGLIVIFHGHVGFDIHAIRYGWENFDLLLPLDNFGWKNLGSWFWGENGNNFTEKIVSALIQKYLEQKEDKTWFTMGASMGGFSSLYYGIKYQASGIYSMAPILNLEERITLYVNNNSQGNAYVNLIDLEHKELNEALAELPNIYREAKAKEELPPLYLIQNQYDASNLFGKHTIPLIQIYNDKQAWCGLRISPAIGHAGYDGTREEGAYFFELIADKRPPSVVDFI